MVIFESKKRDKNHLMNLIKMRSSGISNFAILVGAGASASSGVKLSSQMIDEWRRQLFQQSKTKKTYDEWLKEQDWFRDEYEYSILFEKIYDERPQRRNYIEECVKAAKPSWGYIYLSNIISRNYLNVVFTSNFDDLLNEAAFIYADLRPIVCAHDSAVADIRLTSARPKIIKLHGDFLYDSIKNTLHETERLEHNMREKFKQFAREYGLIVIGYGGNDKSIMDILDSMLGSGDFFPHGVYWCLRKDNINKISKKVKRLLQRDKVYWTEIDGFDEFMAELHKYLGLYLPDTVSDPYKATTRKLNRFIAPEKKIKNEVIREHISELRDHVKKFEKSLKGKASKEDLDELMPYQFIANNLIADGHYKNALEYYKKALDQSPNNIELMDCIFFTNIFLFRIDDALKYSDYIIRKFKDDYLGYYAKAYALSYIKKPDDVYFGLLRKALRRTRDKSTERKNVFISRSNAYLRLKKWKEAATDAKKAYAIDSNSIPAFITLCHAMIKLNPRSEFLEELEKRVDKFEDKYYEACAYAVLGNKEKMMNKLSNSIKEEKINRIGIENDPSFDDYRDDADFKKLFDSTKNILKKLRK